MGNDGGKWEIIRKNGKYWEMMGNNGKCWEMMGNNEKKWEILGNIHPVIDGKDGKYWVIIIQL